MRTQYTSAPSHPCVYCGELLAWHSLKSGKNVEVALVRKGNRLLKPNGAGNNFNFIPIHDCRKAAMQRIEQYQLQLEAMTATTRKGTNQAWLECKKGLTRGTYNGQQRKQLANTLRLCRRAWKQTDAQRASIEALIAAEVPRATAYADWSTRN